MIIHIFGAPFEHPYQWSGSRRRQTAKVTMATMCAPFACRVCRSRTFFGQTTKDIEASRRFFSLPFLLVEHVQLSTNSLFVFCVFSTFFRWFANTKRRQMKRRHRKKTNAKRIDDNVASCFILWNLFSCFLVWLLSILHFLVLSITNFSSKWNWKCRSRELTFNCDFFDILMFQFWTWFIGYSLVDAIDCNATATTKRFQFEWAIRAANSPLLGRAKCEANEKHLLQMCGSSTTGENYCVWPQNTRTIS